MDFIQIQSWRELASKHTIGEIRSITDEVNKEANTKSEKLRLLVGSRFRDLLKTADTVSSMESLVEKHSNALTDIYTSKKKIQLKRLMENVQEFNNPDRVNDTQFIACGSLFRQLEFHIRHQLNHSNNYTSISRSLYLARLVARGDLKKRWDKLQQLFNKTIETELLKAVKYRPEIALELMLSYTVVEQCSPENCLKKFLNYRISIVKQTLNKKTPETLMEGLRLISASIYLFEICFKKNQLRKSMEQQAAANSLLESPDIAKNVDINLMKVASWLPENVNKASSIPQECLEEKYDEKPEIFMSEVKHSFLELLNFSTHDSLISLNNPSIMIELYRKLILLFKESILLRDLSHDTNSWLFSVFHDEWSKRFNEVFRLETNENELMEKELNKVYEELSNDSDAVNSLVSESFFDNSSLFDIVYNGKEENLKDLYSTVNRFRKSATGNSRKFSELLDQWCDKITSWKNQIDDAKSLQSSIISVHSDVVDSDSDMIDDYEKYQKWKEIGTAKVTEFVESMQRECQNQLKETLKNLIEKLHELMIKDNTNARRIVYCIRAIETLKSSLLPFDETIKQTDDLNIGFKKLGDLLDYQLLKSGINEYQSFDLKTWTKSEGISYPTRPSLSILGKLMNFNDYLVGLFGRDNLIWKRCDHQLNEMRGRIGEYLEKDLKNLLSNEENVTRDVCLQIFFDISYVNGIFSTESCDGIKDLSSFRDISPTILDHMINRSNDMISSTNIIYHPLCLSKNNN